MNRGFKAALAILAVLLGGLGFNWFSVTRYSSEVTNRAENSGVSVIAYHHWLLKPSSLVIDVRGIEGKAPVDVIRVLFQIAEQFKAREFSEIRLAYKGDTRFLLPPDKFRTIGRDFRTENPLFTIRTLPETLMRPNGTRAYSTWTGGWLGVAGKQMEDFSSFTDEWFANDVRTRR